MNKITCFNCGKSKERILSVIKRLKVPYYCNSCKGIRLRGQKRSKEVRKKLSISHMGKNNPMWKGDKVGYEALHEWIKNHLVKPQTCRDCNQVKPLDLANISQEYKRDLSDWEWLCRKCHMIKDGRLEKFKSLEKTEEQRAKLSLVHKGIWSGENNPNYQGKITKGRKRKEKLNV